MHSGNYTINNDTFEYLKNISLKHLKIRSTSLFHVDTDAFSPLTELKTLDMSEKGTGMSIADFYPALIGLQKTKIEKLILSNFEGRSENSEIVILNDTSFCDNLNLTHLSVLQMDHAKLFDIESTRSGGCFSELVNLTLLNLSYNYFSVSRRHLFRNSLQSISKQFELDIGHQNHKSHYENGKLRVWFSTNLTKLHMPFTLNSDNEHPIVIEFMNTTRLKYLNFQDNFVRVLKNITFHTNTTIVQLFTADFSRNDMVSFEGAFDYAINAGCKSKSFFSLRTDWERNVVQMKTKPLKI